MHGRVPSWLAEASDCPGGLTQFNHYEQPFLHIGRIPTPGFGRRPVKGRDAFWSSDQSLEPKNAQLHLHAAQWNPYY